MSSEISIEKVYQLPTSVLIVLHGEEGPGLLLPTSRRMARGVGVEDPALSAVLQTSECVAEAVTGADLPEKSLHPPIVAWGVAVEQLLRFMEPLLRDTPGAEG